MLARKYFEIAGGTKEKWVILALDAEKKIPLLVLAMDEGEALSLYQVIEHLEESGETVFLSGRIREKVDQLDLVDLLCDWLHNSGLEEQSPLIEYLPLQSSFRRN